MPRHHSSNSTLSDIKLLLRNIRRVLMEFKDTILVVTYVIVLAITAFEFVLWKLGH